MASIPFSTLPHLVNPTANLSPFSISVPDQELDNLKTLLRLSHIADPNWENSHNDGFFGIPRDVLVNLVEYWQNGYSWRKWESALNSFPQYKITLPDDDGQPYTIHFLALFSSKPSAVPVVLLHGWPGSVLEFLPLLEHVRTQHAKAPAELPYHIVVPHFIGYGFSSPPPRDRDFRHVDNARLVAKLMHALGFAESGYVVQGGDLGGATAPIVSKLDPACRLVHVNMLNIPPPEGTDVEADIHAGRYETDEAASLARTQEFIARGTAFIQLDGTRTSTAGFVIGSNPVSLLAWVGEKMVSWTDATVFDPINSTACRDLLLTNVSLYWFSCCYPTSMYHHRIAVTGLSVLTDGWRDVAVPMGYSWFRKEISNPPKAWIDHTKKVCWYRKHEKGGHFAALEQPEVLWQDIEDFVGEFWAKDGGN
ncbi:Alpha/Beta hydrolase protein [Apodospora peruviana]|uniref:Alpha/Beta hydrolase protein n=1 Tax=Apodospora peruviana TaxID=516989 RepID=A0AAE0MB05_9PEZI|nr:Alpha/Beta hydrolase protein [Apodospora peruviana]